MSLSDSYNIGAKLLAMNGLAVVTQASDTTDDGDTESGHAIDLWGFSDSQRYYSAKAVVLCGGGTLTTAKTISLTMNVQHSSDGTSWDSFSTATVPSAVSITSTQSPVRGEAQQSVNLQGARRYVRLQASADFSATSSVDTAPLSGVWIFGGADTYPAAT